MNNSFQMKIRQGIKFLPYLVCMAFLFAMPVVALAATTVGENVSVGGTFAVTGVSTLTGNVFVTGTLQSTGALTTYGAVTLGDATGDDITVTGYVASSIYPKTDGSYDLGASSTLKRWGYLNASKGLMLSDGTNTSTYYLTSLMLSQASSYNLGKFYIDSSGNVSATGTLAAFGATSLNGAVTLGDATGDDITVTGYIASNVIPKTNDTYDLGAFGKAYNNVFVSSTAYFASVTTTQIAPWANNTSNLGNYDYAWKDVFVSGTLYAGNLSLLGSEGLTITNVSSTNISASGYLDVNGVTTLDGAVTLGDAVNDDITVTGRLGTLLISDGSAATTSITYNAIRSGILTGTYNVGKFHVDTSGNVSATGTLAAFGATSLNGAVTLGDATDDDITVTGYIASHILPKTNDTYNLGAFGKAYNDVFASGTAYSASSTVYNPSTTSTVYISSDAANTGGQIILKAYNGTCYAVYIGQNDVNGVIGVTSTALAACY